MTAIAPAARGMVTGARRSSGVWRAYRAERRKLAAQLPTRLLAVVCVLGPFAFAGIMKAQSGLPADTLFGVWARSSGYATALVVLGFAGSWGFPVIAGVVAGDLFSSEDRYGTWKTALTRSCTRGELFAGKVVAGSVFTMGLLGLLAVASVAAGLLLVGGHSLVSLSGILITPGRALVLVLASWLVSALPALAFMSLAILFSVSTRNGIAGVMGPSVINLVMQLLGLLGTGVWVHTLLVASAFDDWHGLFTVHQFFGPLAAGCLVSIVWVIACLGASWAILRKRDFAGTPTRAVGWGLPTRVTLAFLAVIAFLALASGWGPAGITAARLRHAIAPTFNNLTLLQQRLLGRTVPPGAKLNVLTTCNRRAGASKGPGDDWVCTLDVFIPQPGAVPFAQTPVTYDISVKANGCYKAQAPPSFVGQQLMRDPAGQNIINPLFTIYGCFNPL